MKCIIWCRVSTVVQDIESQKNEMIELAKLEGYVISDMLILESKGASAIKLNDLYKNEVNELIELINSRNDIKCVYVWEISRLARNEEFFYKMKNEIVSKKIQLRVKTPDLKLLNDDGTINAGQELALNIMVTLAKQEMELKKNRFQRGRQRMADMNKWIGGNLSFGYTYDKMTKEIIPNEEESKLVQYIFNSYINGESQRQLADEFNRKNIPITLSLINRILHNERYIGISMNAKERGKIISKIKRAFPQIISKETFELAQKIAKNNNVKPKSKKIYYADNLLYCSECGGRCNVQTTSYHCFNSFNKYMKLSLKSNDKDTEEKLKKQCKNKTTISVNVLDSLIWNIVKNSEIIDLNDNNDNQLIQYQIQKDKLNEQLKNIEYKLKLNENKKQRLLLAMVNGLNENNFNKKQNEINNEKKILNNDFNSIKENINQIDSFINDLNNRKNEIKDMGIDNLIDTYSDEDIQNCIRRHINYITYKIINIKNERYTLIEVTWNKKKSNNYGITYFIDGTEEDMKKIELKKKQLNNDNIKVISNADENYENIITKYLYSPTKRKFFEIINVPNDNYEFEEKYLPMEIQVNQRIKNKYKEKMKILKINMKKLK